MVATNALYLALLTGSLAGQAVATSEVEERGIFQKLKGITNGAKKVNAAIGVLDAGAQAATLAKKPSKRDYDELDERDFDELDERGLFSAFKGITNGAKKVNAAIGVLDAGAQAATLAKKPGKRYIDDLLERDFDELDERDLEALEELAQRSLAGNIGRGANAIKSIFTLAGNAKEAHESRKGKRYIDDLLERDFEELDERDLEALEELTQRSLAGNIGRGANAIKSIFTLAGNAKEAHESRKGKRYFDDLAERDFDELDERDFEDYEELVLRDDEEEPKPKKSVGHGRKGKGGLRKKGKGLRKGKGKLGLKGIKGGLRKSKSGLRKKVKGHRKAKKGSQRKAKHESSNEESS